MQGHGKESARPECKTGGAARDDMAGYDEIDRAQLEVCVPGLPGYGREIPIEADRKAAAEAGIRVPENCGFEIRLRAWKNYVRSLFWLTDLRKIFNLVLDRTSQSQPTWTRPCQG